ncbi:hypothetical protein BJ741DRAFT_317464 [Chytriomyces cf. hyalinus JEL632]|nr:hypothetical protein BJ741DRAFT_317464 [Chytriomyces cf. hyalinus JEL632]
MPRGLLSWTTTRSKIIGVLSSSSFLCPAPAAPISPLSCVCEYTPYRHPSKNANPRTINTTQLTYTTHTTVSVACACGKYQKNMYMPNVTFNSASGARRLPPMNACILFRVGWASGVRGLMGSWECVVAGGETDWIVIPRNACTSRIVVRMNPRTFLGSFFCGSVWDTLVQLYSSNLPDELGSTALRSWQGMPMPPPQSEARV